MSRIAIIGAGNIGSAMARGLLAAGWAANDVLASCRSEASLQAFRKICPLSPATLDSGDIAAQSDVILLCVKPKDVAAACAKIAPESGGSLLISVVTGVTIATIARCLNNEAQALARSMPNLPIIIAKGVSALYANEDLTEKHKLLCERIFSAVGNTHWVASEEELDLVTAVSGSGPAYLYRVMEAFEKAACAIGLNEELARALVTETTLGSAILAQTRDVKTLRRQITSPAGTTEKAIAVLERAAIDELFANTVTAAARRAREISSQIEKDTGPDGHL